MRAARPIISHPEHQTRAQRITTRSLKAIILLVWLYIWIPVLSAILWVLGIHVTYIYIVRAPSQTSWLLILVIMMSCNVIVSSWSIYNWVRFVGKKRRRGAPLVTHEEVGKVFGVTDPATLSLLIHERRLNLYFDNAGVLIRVEALGDEEKEELLLASASH
jgi:biofilm PGA synthesis protein PgaD